MVLVVLMSIVMDVGRAFFCSSTASGMVSLARESDTGRGASRGVCGLLDLFCAVDVDVDVERGEDRSSVELSERISIVAVLRPYTVSSLERERETGCSTCSCSEMCMRDRMLPPLVPTAPCASRVPEQA